MDVHIISCVAYLLCRPFRDTGCSVEEYDAIAAALSALVMIHFSFPSFSISTKNGVKSRLCLLLDMGVLTRYEDTPTFMT